MPKVVIDIPDRKYKTRRKQMKLINESDIDYILAPIAPVLKGEKVHYEQVAFRKQIEAIPPITEKEEVKIICQHKIDDLIKQIEDIPTIKKSDTGKMILMGEGMKREVIKILEEAKK